MSDPDQAWWQDPQHRCRVCDQPILDDDDGRCGGCIDEGREPVTPVDDAEASPVPRGSTTLGTH